MLKTIQILTSQDQPVSHWVTNMNKAINIRNLNHYRKYLRVSNGDINGFFTLFLDNVVSIAALVFLLISFGFPKSIIYENIVPAICLGVFIGDLIFFVMSVSLSEKHGNENMTAMPLGFDLPTAVGIGLTVIGPAFLVLQNEYGDVDVAARQAWYIGAGATVTMGLIKFVLAFFGNAIEKFIPKVGLIGPIAGIGLVWLGANALLGTYSVAFVGLLSLSIVVYCLVCGFRFPGNIPGAAAAILISTFVFYCVGQVDAFGVLGAPSSIPGLGDYLGFYPGFSGIGCVSVIVGTHVVLHCHHCAFWCFGDQY